MLSFFFVANYALSYASLFRLRTNEPDAHRPYPRLGIPWTSALALMASAAFLLSSLGLDLKNAIQQHEWWPPPPPLLAFAILLVSYPLFA